MKKAMTVLCCMFLLILAGCGQRGNVVDADNMITIYEVNIEETKLGSHPYDIDNGVGDILIERVIDELSTAPENAEMRAAIQTDMKINSYQLLDETLTIDFAEGYYKQDSSAEVLSRAAIVKTLTQIDGVDYVQFTIGGMPLSLNQGAPLGAMSASHFIDDADDSRAAKEQVNLTLYYADESGNRLVKINRKLEYSSNISVEKLVVEQLIAGVSDETDPEEAFPVINPDTKLISAMISDGVCYVNLNSAFLSQVYETSAEVTIYSIVNSLVELPDVNKVQISINGNSDIVFLETLPLSALYERNLELVKE